MHKFLMEHSMYSKETISRHKFFIQGPRELILMGRGLAYLCVLLLLVPLVFSASVDPFVEKELEKNPTIKVNVIMKDKAKEKISIENIQSLPRQSKKGILKISHKFESINAYSAEIDSASLQDLKNDPNVKNVEIDYNVEKHLSLAVPVMKADQVWPFQPTGINLTGTGEVICVIDTGVNYHHPVFGNCTIGEVRNGTCRRVIGGYDYCNDDDDPIDVDGHGTNVAGIAISNDTANRGVAQNAKIVALKVFDDSGSGSSSDVVAAIDWCVNNATRFNITVITMSLGYTGFYSNSTCNSYSTTTTAAITNAIKNNISVIASSGNEATWGIRSPACTENVTSVGAVYDSDMGSLAWSPCTDSATGANNITCFTNRGPNLYLLAPGSRLTSASMSGGTATYSGTSQAAPMVAGSTAILRQFIKLQNGTMADPKLLQRALNQTGDFIVDSNLTQLSFSRLNLLAAVRYLDASPPQVNLLYPANGSYLKTRNITFNFTINDPHPIANATLYGNLSAGFVFGANASNTTLLANNNITTIIVSNVTGGQWIWNIQGCDNNSKCGLTTANFTFTVDFTPPSINFSSETPANGSTVNNNYFLANISSSETIANLSFYIFNSSGSLLGQYNLTNQTYNNYTGLSTGTYFFNATGSDLAVNSNSTLTYTVSVDTSIPLPQGAVAVTGNNKTNLNVTFNVSWKDSAGVSEGLSGYIFSHNQSDTFVNSSWVAFTTSNVSTARLNITLTHNKVIAYRFFANDSSNFFNSTSIGLLTVANTPPSAASILSPQNNSFNSTINISAFSTDEDNETITFYYFVN